MAGKPIPNSKEKLNALSKLVSEGMLPGVAR